MQFYTVWHCTLIGSVSRIMVADFTVIFHIDSYKPIFLLNWIYLASDR